MTKAKTIRKTNLITEDRLAKWNDTEVLTNLKTILTRADIATEFVVQDLEEGSIITHETLIAICGDKAFVSEPRPLEWPLQQMPIPDAFKEKMN